MIVDIFRSPAHAPGQGHCGYALCLTPHANSPDHLPASRLPVRRALAGDDQGYALQLFIKPDQIQNCFNP